MRLGDLPWVLVAVMFVIGVVVTIVRSIRSFRSSKALLVTTRDNRVAFIRIIPLRCAACGCAFQDGESVVNADNGAIAHLSCKKGPPS